MSITKNVQKKMGRYTAIACAFMFAFTCLPANAGETHMDTLRRAFSELRTGQFLHFGMNSFNGTGNDQPNLAVSTYNPAQINPRQWASGAKQAGFKFMVLTAKHHDGFCLWNTATTTYNCMNPGVPVAARKDVVSLFTTACRDSGIWPVIYFSVQDRSWNGAALHISTTDPVSRSGVTNGRLAKNLVDYTMNQMKELLCNYGFIPFFVDDGWAWSMGHTIIPYQDFRDTMYKYSPNTIFSEHEGLFYPWHEDIIYFENSKGVWPSTDNIYASWLSNKMGSGGYWYWVPGDAGRSPGKSVPTVLSTWVDVCDPVWCHTSPNLMPNNQGLIQPEYVAWEKQFGDSIRNNPNHIKASRAKLPAQPTHMEYVITAVGATATSSGSSSKPVWVMDGVSDGGFLDHYTQSIWVSGNTLPQSVTVDLGKVYDSIGMVTYLPPQIARGQATKDSSGTITGYQIFYSTDNTTFTQVSLDAADSSSTGTWKSNIKIKYALFAPVSARYMRLVATASIGNVNAQVSELDFGRHVYTPAHGWGYVGNVPVGNRANSSEPVMQRVGGSKHAMILTSTNGFLNIPGVMKSANGYEIYGMDGKKLGQSNGVVYKLPSGFAAKSYVVKAK